MKQFFEDFAKLSRIMRASKFVAISAMKSHNDAETKREELILQNAHDLKTGVYNVPGGHVVVSKDGAKALLVNFYPEN